MAPSIHICGGVCGGVKWINSEVSLAVFHRLKNGDEHSALMELIREISANAGCSSMDGIMMGWSSHWSNIRNNINVKKDMFSKNE